MATIAVISGTTLGQALKLGGLVMTGGEAKMLVADGRVKVNSGVELRRGYKVQEGDLVEVGGAVLRVSVRDREDRVRPTH